MELNTEVDSLSDFYTAKHDAQTGAVATLLGGAVATVADFGTTVYNSLAPERYETTTEDVLRRVSDNALRVYEENPDTIKTASFIGGMFVPAGLAVKGMNLIRAGAKGTSWYSTARRSADIGRLEELMRAGPAAASEYKALRNGMFARNFGNAMLDNLGAEAAILLSMNDHPFMEDYLEDPIKNFGISMAIGGVIGGGIGHVAERYALNKVAAGVEEATQAKVLDQLDLPAEGVNQGLKLAAYERNIKNLENMLGNKDKPLDELTKGYAERSLLRMKSLQEEEFTATVGGAFKSAPQEFRDGLKQMLSEDSTFGMVDRVGPLKVSPKLMPNGQFDIDPIDEAAWTKVKKVKDENGVEVDVEVAATAIYYPEQGSFGAPRDVSKIGRANALKGVDGKALAEGTPKDKRVLRYPNQDAIFEIEKQSAPLVDKAYAEAAVLGEKMTAKELQNAVVSPDDPVLLGAAYIAWKRLQGEMPADWKLRITRREPKYTDDLVQRIFKSNGVSADHHKKMLEFTNPKALAEYDLFKADVPGLAKDMLRQWKSGSGVARMRTASDAAHFGGYGRLGVDENDIKAYTAMWKSPASENLRNKFRSLADAEGNVYLWRGMKQDPTGHAALQSYSTDYVKASEFGTPRLFKVHVDDIVGAIADLKSHDGYYKNEIIVRAPARPVEPMLPVGMAGKEIPASQVAAVSTSDELVDLQGLYKTLVTKKESLIQSMNKQGASALEISIRTNTPIEGVQHVLTSAPEEASLLLAGVNPMQYSSVDAVRDYLTHDKRPLRMRMAQSKLRWGKELSQLDTKTMDDISHQLIKGFMAGGAKRSALVGELNELLHNPSMSKFLDIVRAELSKATNSLAGSRFVQSADRSTQDLGDLGTALGHIGREMSSAANRTVKRVVVPVTEAMERIKGSPAAVYEANLAIQTQARLSGKIRYHERKFWQWADTLGPDGKLVKDWKEVLVQGREFAIQNDAVDEMLQALKVAGDELYSSQATVNNILGRKVMSNRGFWVPAFDPRNKHIAYVVNTADDTTSVLIGNTPDELEKAVGLFKAARGHLIDNGTIKLIRKGEQAEFNSLIGRKDPVSMGIANIEQHHGGASSPTITPNTTDIFNDIIGGLEYSIQSRARTLVDVNLYDISATLRLMSKVNTNSVANQPLDKLKAAFFKPKDAAKELRDTMLSLKGLPDYHSWQTVNDGFEMWSDLALHTVSKVWNTVTGPMKGFVKKELPLAARYEAFVEGLRKEGMVNSYEVFGEEAARMWETGSIPASKDLTKRAIYASNALISTAALRFADIAHPLVNAMSLPILMSATVAEKMPATFLGAKLGTAKVGPVEAMMDGLRAMHSDKFAHWEKAWKAKGWLDPIVSEASEVQKLTREFDSGVLASIEKAVDHKVVNMMSKASDYSEALVRKSALYTGAHLAKRLYPELGEEGLFIFARQFMDRVVGNYHAPQRPVFFQGTMGTALGLFQTYMLTYVQSMYRNMQLKNYKALGTMAVAQSTIFGMRSMPGFEPISQMIGENFSDDHYDLQTGTLRAVGDGVGKLALYGLPSNLGPGFYTRGDVAPRGVTPLNLESLPIVNAVGQMYNLGSNLIGAAGVDGEEMPRALAQAISLQSISRPLARGAELLMGQSVTAPGSTVQTEDDVWSVTGVMARALGTRPTEEVMLREANHLRRYYEAADRENRQKVIAKLKTAIRNGSLDQAQTEKLALDYMEDGGTPQGWRSVVNTAVTTTKEGLSKTMQDQLKPNSALNYMIDTLDGQDNLPADGF